MDQTQNAQTNFSDIIKKSAIEQFTGTLSAQRVLLTLLAACLVGLFIFLIYRKTFIGVLYSRAFGLSLVMMTMVTALIILPITSNLTLSLGMVGALSIVRFRTAVKDAMDTMYMFWCVAAGICLGAGFYAVAAVGSLFVGLVMVLLNSAKMKVSLPFLLVIHFDEQATADVRKLLNTVPKAKLKSKTRHGGDVEMTIEIRLSDGQDNIVDHLNKIEGVFDASLLSYQGDMVS